MEDRALAALLRAMAAEARRLDLRVDEEVYRKFGKDPARPIAFAGQRDARVCVLGRDLGNDEVRWGQPLVGQAGRLVRRGVLAAAGVVAPPGDRRLESALDHVFLTNLVPYKPPGNRPFAARVRAAFAPFVERLLCCFWRGDTVITLGAETFRWFAGHGDADAVAAALERGERFSCRLECAITARCSGRRVTRRVTLCPLPHPSPANASWIAYFPELLRRRLDSALAPLT